MKRTYVTPSIARQRNGLMNAQAHGQSVPACSEIDGVSVEELVREHGSPLYVFSEQSLRRAYRETHRAFKRRYPDVQFAWSYKTNYLKAVCSVFHQEGAIAEVVSDFEYEKARGLGIAGSDIIFNGPYKSVAALERAIAEGAKLQIDNLDELNTIGELAEARGQSVDVAIRVYMDCGVRPVWSKFGFNADGHEAQQAIKRIHNHPYLRLVGLHTHVGTFILGPEVYGRAVERLLDLAESAHREFGCEIEYLNLGGGFPSHNQLHYQYYPAEQVVPPIDDYAEAICRPILDRWPQDRKLPRLYLETGRAVVDDAGYLLTTIVATKTAHTSSHAMPAADYYDSRKKAGRPQAEASTAPDYLVDAGINLLYTAAWYQFNVQPTREVAGPLHPRTVYGCLCMNIDVLRQRVALPNLHVGDQLVFHPIGAYNVTQSMQFITYRPRVVLITEDGEVEIIRERDDLRHVEALERLPEHLATDSPPVAVPMTSHVA